MPLVTIFLLDFGLFWQCLLFFLWIQATYHPCQPLIFTSFYCILLVGGGVVRSLRHLLCFTRFRLSILFSFPCSFVPFDILAFTHPILQILNIWNWIFIKYIQISLCTYLVSAYHFRQYHRHLKNQDEYTSNRNCY